VPRQSLDLATTSKRGGADDDTVLVGEGAADDVGAEAAYGRLDALDDEFDADGDAEEGDIGFLGQPGGEVNGLVGPVVARRELCQLAEGGVSHGRESLADTWRHRLRGMAEWQA